MGSGADPPVGRHPLLLLQPRPQPPLLKHRGEDHLLPEGRGLMLPLLLLLLLLLSSPLLPVEP